MINRLKRAACLLIVIASPVLAEDAADRKFIREGMSEGEVVMKIGKPDSETLDSGASAALVVKKWVYMPAAGDPQTVTTIVIRGGTVGEITRQIAR